MNVTNKHMATPRKEFTELEARATALKLGIDFATCGFDLETFMDGMNVELEHGTKDPETNITNDDPIMTGKIAWIHLKESDDYYEDLEKMEEHAKQKEEMKDLKGDAEEVGMKIKAANKLRESMGMY